MKSDLKGPKKQEAKKQKYPCLMIDVTDGGVLLMTAPETGVIVHETGKEKTTWGLGYYAEDWDEAMLEPLLGKIILEND